MSHQLSIRMALLGAVAICGCSTGTPDFSSLNPFSALSAKQTPDPAQQSLSFNGQPKKLTPSLDWFRRSATTNLATTPPNQQSMLAQQAQAMARQQAAMASYPRMQQAAPQGFGAAYPPASQQITSQRGPFANPSTVATTTPPVGMPYGSAKGYAAPTNGAPQYGVMPQTTPAQQFAPAQNAAVASYGSPSQPSPQYAPPAYATAPAQYSTASQHNAPQYTQPSSFQGGSLR